MCNHRLMIVLGLAGAVLAPSVLAAEPGPVRAQEQVQQQVRGSDLMSPQERAQHREQMRNLNTEQERNAYRQQQHKLMQERANEQGLSLPDRPRAGGGMGMGGGRGGAFGGGRR